MEELIFSVEAHSSKELRHFKFISVSFMAQLLGSASFIGKVNEATSSNSLLLSLKCLCWICVTDNRRRRNIGTNVTLTFDILRFSRLQAATMSSMSPCSRCNRSELQRKCVCVCACTRA